MTTPDSTTDRLAEAAALAAVPDEAADIASKLVRQIVSGHLDAALESVERGDGGFEDYSPHPISIEGDARAIVAAVTPILLAQVQGRLDTAEGRLATLTELHKPERRYTPNLAESCSFDTPEEAAEYDDIDIDLVTHFNVCAHCGPIEMGDGDPYGRDYRESLWPCETAKTLGLDKEPSDV